MPLPDDQADDQAGELSPRDELVCGAELIGPAGAFAVVGRAAYVPSGAESWHAAICAAVAPATRGEADAQTEVTQLVVALDNQAASYESLDDQADDSRAGYEQGAEEIAGALASQRGGVGGSARTLSARSWTMPGSNSKTGGRWTWPNC